MEISEVVLSSLSMTGGSGDLSTLTEMVSPVLHVGDNSLETSTIYSKSLYVSPVCHNISVAVNGPSVMDV